MDAPIVGDIKFSELDYIPDNFKSYLTDTAPTIDTSSFKQKLSQLELGMSLENFLKLFPDAKLQEHKIDTYENTGESFERRDYEYRYHSFVFSDGKLNSYRNKLSL